MAMLQTLRFNLATTACLYLTAIVLLSLQGSLVSSAVVSLIGVGCLAYYFAPPIYSFRVDDPFNGTRAAGIISRIRLLFNKGAPQLEPVDAPSSKRMAASCGPRQFSSRCKLSPRRTRQGRGTWVTPSCGICGGGGARRIPARCMASLGEDREFRAAPRAPRLFEIIKGSCHEVEQDLCSDRRGRSAGHVDGGDGAG
jgi:hypothetical protein